MIERKIDELKEWNLNTHATDTYTTVLISFGNSLCYGWNSPITKKWNVFKMDDEYTLIGKFFWRKIPESEKPYIHEHRKHLIGSPVSIILFDAITKIKKIEL